MTTRQDRANAIRALSMDAVQKAKSGHPGAPMGMADIAEVLWCDYLNHNPANPDWADRDRFVLSNGHGSMLLYSLLHLSGYDLTIDDLPVTRNMAMPPVLKPPPVRWVRVLPMLSVWRLPRRCWRRSSTVPVTRLLITLPTRSSVMAA